MKYSARNLAKSLLKLTQGDSGNQQKIVASFLDFCKEKKLAHLLPNVLRYLKIEIKNEEDVKTLKIFTATELSDDIIKSIQKACHAHPDSPTNIIEDKSIVAGFTAYYQNKIIDASLKNNLHILKNKITA